MTKDEKKLADKLFKIGCIKFGAFRLKLHETNPNAPLSPIYINLRLLQSHPKVMKNTISVVSTITEKLKFDVIAAIPMAATPLGEAFSLKADIPLITPRPPKTHGLNSGVDGVYNKGQVALLLDDLVTKADSKIDAVKNLRGKGLKVKNLVVLIDREQGGEKELNKQKIKLHKVFTLIQLLNYYKESGKIDEETYQKTAKYLSSNP